ncbi:MAG: phage portal protein [Pseudomonadota bacterium]
MIDRTSGRKRAARIGPKERTKVDLENVRSQARDLYRHNPYARGTVNSIVANLVGCGIRPQPRVLLPKKGTPDQKFNDVAEEEWKRWADKCDPSGRESFYFQQQELQREFYVAGEALVAYSVPRDGRKTPLATSILPSERLSMLEELNRKDGTSIFQGVESTVDGRILAYWLYPNHPYESVYGSDKPYRVPADQVIHFFDSIEPEQIRGLSKFATVSGAFEGFMQWLDWLLTKERISAAFAVAITENAGLTVQSPLQTDDTDDLVDENGNAISVLEGGMVAHLRPGEDIKGIASGVQASSVDLLSQIFLRVIARGLDVAYELVARDLTKVTYLSARQGENQDRRHWEPQQENMNRVVNVPVWRRFVDLASMSGVIPKRAELDRMAAVDFVRPGWDWIDPGKDVAADISAIQAGIRSPLEVIQGKGGDAWKVLNDIATFRDWAKEKKLELSIFQPAKPAPILTDVAEPKEPMNPDNIMQEAMDAQQEK